MNGWLHASAVLLQWKDSLVHRAQGADRAGVDASQTRKISYSCWESKHGPVVVESVA
jgi:hypothetical protein